jgi:hypothetical protein
MAQSLNFNTNYNIASDSLNWSPLTMSGVIPLTQKIDLNFDANFDPYALNNNNQRINTFNVNNGGSLMRLTRAGARVSFSLSNKDFESSDEEDEDNAAEDDRVANRQLAQGGRQDDLFGKSVDTAGEQRREDKEEKVDIDKKRYRFKIPWNLNINYTMSYNNAARQNEINRNSLMLSGMYNSLLVGPLEEIQATILQIKGYRSRPYDLTVT